MYTNLKEIRQLYVEDVHADEVRFSDGKLITVVVQYGMIFVAECDYAELQRRIDAGDLDSYEAYDTTDGCSYYLSSKYAVYVSDVLLRIANCCGFCH